MLSNDRRMKDEAGREEKRREEKRREENETQKSTQDSADTGIKTRLLCPSRLLNCAVTNDPNIKDMFPLSSSGQPDAQSISAPAMPIPNTPLALSQRPPPEALSQRLARYVHLRRLLRRGFHYHR